MSEGVRLQNSAHDRPQSARPSASPPPCAVDLVAAIDVFVSQPDLAPTTPVQFKSEVPVRPAATVPQ